MKGAIFSVVACVLVLNIGVSSALNCYVCTKTNGTGDVGCDANPIKPDPVACTATAPLVPHCARLKAKVTVGQDVVPIVSRLCLPLPAETKVGCVTEYPTPGYTDIEYCLCQEDNCNGDNPAPQVLVAHFTLPLLGLFLRQAFSLL